MTDEFKKQALSELIKTFPYACEKDLLEIASILWDLIPKFYNGNQSDQKCIK